MRILLSEGNSFNIYEVEYVGINPIFNEEQKGFKKVAVDTGYYSVEIVATTPNRPQAKGKIFIPYLTKDDVDNLVDDLYSNGKADLRWVKEWHYTI